MEIKNLIKEEKFEKIDFAQPENYVLKLKPGLNEETIKEISNYKNEPKWMLDFRLKSFEIFKGKALPNWGVDLSNINFDEIIYYIKPWERKASSWEELPQEIKTTFERLGIPEQERKFLGGIGGMYESEIVIHKIREQLAKKGIIFTDPESALKQHEELFKKWFGKIVPPGDNKFAALNSAVWSGGSFIYVPKDVEVELPLQAYFRINSRNVGQFERTLIIADEGAKVTYIEGCSSPLYTKNSLHAAVVEIIALKNAHVRYITIQNWSRNVYNLVTKRAFAYENASVEWFDFNCGSKATMKYPCVYLLGERAKANTISISIANRDQHQDAGAKVLHLAPNTSSKIISKSISLNGGRTSYRGLLKIIAKAKNSKSFVKCDALLLDKFSRSDSYPTTQVDAKNAIVAHEASVGKIDENKIFYLTSRGLNENEAKTLILLGFMSDFVNVLPLEQAIEFKKLIELELEK